MSDSAQEKKHYPTYRRLQEARNSGNVPLSRDLSTSAGLLAATGMMVSFGAYIVHQLTGSVADTLARLGDAPLRDVRPEDLARVIVSGGTLVAMTAGPIALAAAGTSFLVGTVQTGFNFAPAAVQLNFGRLSPAAGLKKLSPSRSGIDTLKTIVIATVLAALAWPIVNALVTDASRLSWSNPMVSVLRGWDDSTRLLWRAGLMLLVLGVADYAIQKWRFIKPLKMTDQEAKEEHKMQEGNAEVKGRIRRIQRDLHRRRMMKNVPKATVILTNPTHYAVALEYRREKNVAPVVVAKGADLVAAKIREIGRQHGVPIIENPPLTRALFKECEIGDVIPGPLFGAVAEVLAYLVRIKQLVL
jgi:flagellar biosynthetic protein FlhB